MDSDVENWEVEPNPGNFNLLYTVGMNVRLKIEQTWRDIHSTKCKIDSQASAWVALDIIDNLIEREHKQKSALYHQRRLLWLFIKMRLFYSAAKFLRPLFLCTKSFDNKVLKLSKKSRAHTNFNIYISQLPVYKYNLHHYDKSTWSAIFSSL